MSQNFDRAIHDLDSHRPGAFQDARQAILEEIRCNPRVDPASIVGQINQVEMEPYHAHRQVQLVQNQGYLDVAPLVYEQPRRPINGGAVAAGIAGGVLLDELFHRDHHENHYRRPGW